MGVWFAMRYFALLLVLSSTLAVADLPRSPPSPLERAEQQIGAGKLDEALATLEQVPAKEARRFILRGEIFRLKQDFAKAQDELQKALAIQPTLAQVRAERGALLIELGRNEEAAAELRRAVADKPELEDEWFNLGTVELQLGRCKEAVTAFEMATQRKPKDASNWIERARAELKCGKGDAALASARRATQLPKADAGSFLVLGFIAEKVKKLDEAADAYRRAQKLDDKSAAAAWSLGLLELGRDRPAQAVPELERAVALDPSAPKLTDLARAKALLGKSDEAEKLFEQALQKGPRYHGARLLLGQLYVQKKRCKDLGRLLQPLDADPKHKAAVDKLRGDCK